MPNIVPSVLLHNGFLTYETIAFVEHIEEGGLGDAPSWLSYGREFEEIFPTDSVRNVGGFNTIAYSCGWWDVHPVNFLAFMQSSRTLLDSRLYVPEVVNILSQDHVAKKGTHLKSPFYFIAQGRHGEFRLIEAKRNQGRGFAIESSREICSKSKIHRGCPLFVPLHYR